MATTTTTPQIARGTRVHGVTPSGRIIRTGELLDYQPRASQTSEAGGEYEAIVRWDGDTHDSLVSLDRIQPADTKPAPDASARAAALATLAYQADPTTDGLITMQDAIDRALTAGATHADILAARTPENRS